MVKQRRSRTLCVAGVLVLVIVGVVSAQSSQSGPSSIADLLTEVRGLRADVNRAASASMRVQVLVARVSLQEQRINAVVRELTEARSQLVTADRERSDLERRVKGFEDGIAARTATPAQLRDLETMLPQLKADLSQRQAGELQLRNHEADLLALLTSEQGRWTNLNGRLDDLERTLPSPEQR